jgi:myo-inositol-1(or 4)-monophosphatase
MSRETLSALAEASNRVRDALKDLADWSLDGSGHESQYRHDIVADEVLVEYLGGMGFGLLSEESPLVEAEPGRPLIVMDPVDGSTNASLRIPHFAVSLCAFGADGATDALVHDLGKDEVFSATRGGGAFLNGRPIAVDPVPLSKAVIGVSGPAPLGGRWWQHRALGASAIDLCWVACGRLHGFVDSANGSRIWDNAAGQLICEEAGGILGSYTGADLWKLDRDYASAIAVGATREILDEILQVTPQ